MFSKPLAVDLNFTRFSHFLGHCVRHCSKETYRSSVSDLFSHAKEMLYFIINVDIALQPVGVGGYVTKTYSLLCSLLVLGDDLSRVDRVTISQALCCLQESVDRFVY